MTITTLLTDIEGTTSSIHFVKAVLFPYAARAMGDFVFDHHREPAVREQLDAVAAETGLPANDLDCLVATLLNWIEADRKATPLKALQGMIWKAGYEQGAYQAHVYPDAAVQLQRWHEQGLALNIYSSGSIAAQQLFFQYSEAGDLRPLFEGFFDTTSGPKQEAQSYRNILQALDTPAAQVLFLSDVVAELDAAREAGLHTCWLQRPDDLPEPGPRDDHPRVQRFDQIDLAHFA